MAEATTSNQNHGATSTTSDHVAQNAAPDVCFTPDKKAVIPHDNSVNTDKATTHTSDKTKIHEGPAVRQGDKIGAPSKAGDGAACGKGVASGTCQEEASIITGSPNVVVEGAALGRKTDPTKQNHGNTTGTVQGGDPHDTAKSLHSEKAELCQFAQKTVTIDGKATQVPDISVKCDHRNTFLAGTNDKLAAAVSPPGKDPNAAPVPRQVGNLPITVAVKSGSCKGREASPLKVLEVTTPVEIKLLAKRINAKEKDKSPDCEEHEHTEWTIEREAHKDLKTAGRKQVIKDKDSYTITKDWFAWPGQTEIEASGRSPKELGEARTEQNRDKWREDHPKMTDKNVDKNADRQTGAEAGRMKAGGVLGSAVELTSSVYQIQHQAREFWEYWHADHEPVIVEIEAEACSGKATYTIRSFPSQKATFTLSTETLAKIAAAIQVIVKIFQSAKKICALGGGKVDGEVHFLEGFAFEATVNWAEMQEDKPAKKLYKYNVDREWSAQIKNRLGKGLESKGNFAKLIAKFGMEVLAFLNAFLPSGGTLLAKAINILGLSVTVGVDISCVITVELGIEKKAGSAISFTGGFDAAIDLYLNLTASYSGWLGTLEMSIGVIVKFNPGITARFPTDDLWAAKAKFEPGDIKMGVKGVMKIDTWGYKTNGPQKVEYYPDAFHVSYDGFELAFLSNVKQ